MWFRSGAALLAVEVLAAGLSGCSRPVANELVELEPEQEEKQSAPSSEVPPDEERDTQPGEELLDEARQALRELSSVRLTTVMQTRLGNLEVNLHADDEGRCAGRVNYPLAGQAAGPVDVLRDGDEVWLRPADLYWQDAGGQSAVDSYGGMYVHAPADHPGLESIVGLCDEALNPATLDPPEGTTTTSVIIGEESTHRGQPAVTVVQEGSGASDGAEASFTFDIVLADLGRRQPLSATIELIYTEPESGMLIVDYEWHDHNVPVDVQVPPAGLVVELDALEVQVDIFS